MTASEKRTGLEHLFTGRITLRELRDSGFRINDFISQGFTLADVANEEYARAGFTLKDLYTSKFGRTGVAKTAILAHLIEKGFDIDGWRQLYDVTALFDKVAAPELSLLDRLKAGFGVGAGDQERIATILRELRMEDEWTLEEFVAQGWPISDIKALIGQDRLHALIREGLVEESLGHLYGKPGFTPEELEAEYQS